MMTTQHMAPNNIAVYVLCEMIHIHTYTYMYVQAIKVCNVKSNPNTTPCGLHCVANKNHSPLVDPTVSCAIRPCETATPP